MPAQYNTLYQVPPFSLFLRLHLLRRFSDAVYQSLPLFNVDPERSLANGLENLRSLLHSSGKIALLRSWISQTEQEREIGPTIVLNRFAAKDKRQTPLFIQAAKQLPDTTILRASKRAWKAQFTGEGAEDAGGPYNESIAEMCEELLCNDPQSPAALFGLTPNGQNKEGDFQDLYVLRKSRPEANNLNFYRFLGVLMAVAIRTKSPLRLFLAPLFWKRLLQINITEEDLMSVDKSFVSTHHYILNIDKYGINDEESFELLPLEAFLPLQTGANQELPLTFANRKEYVEKAFELQMDSCALEFAAIRKGMENLLPVSLLSLFTASELELLVCGSAEINWEPLRANTAYRGAFTVDSKQIIWLWEELEAMSPDDRSHFLRFVWGHTRLPSDPSDIRQQFLVQSGSNSPADEYLPTAQTCFFKLVLPTYSSRQILSEKLLYAIRFCRVIDTDDYARQGNIE